MQMADTAAANIRHLLAGTALETFRFKNPGTLATIGRTSAVARLGRFRFTGFLAWALWLVVHIVQLIGFRNRLLVLVNWAWDYFLYDRAVRLITRPEHGTDAREDAAREGEARAPLERRA